MEGSIEAVVTFKGIVRVLRVQTYADLQTQVQTLFPSLSRDFRLIARGDFGELPLDSLLPSTSPLHITVHDSRRPVNRARTQATMRVRLANLAYLTKYGAVKETEEVVEAEEVPQEEMCPICMERWQRPMKAKCGHVCCLACWERALAQYLECPLCRSHVRLKTLRPFPCTAS